MGLWGRGVSSAKPRTCGSIPRHEFVTVGSWRLPTYYFLLLSDMQAFDNQSPLYSICPVTEKFEIFIARSRVISGIRELARSQSDHEPERPRESADGLLLIDPARQIPERLPDHNRRDDPLAA